MIDRDRLRAQLRVHEGLRLKPYADSVGKITIGIGRNLTDVGISTEEAALLCEHDIDRVLRELSSRTWWRSLDEVRARAIADMDFNLGVGELIEFEHMIAALRAGAYDRAAAEMLDSRWARQVGGRARTLAAMMRTGQDVIP